MDEVRNKSAHSRGTNLFSTLAASEAFGVVWILSAPIQNAKSEEVGCRPSEPLDSLIGGVLTYKRGVWEGRNTVYTLFFCALHSVIPCFHVLEY